MTEVSTKMSSTTRHSFQKLLKGMNMMAPTCTKKTAGTYPVSEEYDVDDELDECVWLFPGTKSPPSSTSGDHLLTKRFSFCLSISRSSRLGTNPIDEEFSLLRKAPSSSVFQEDLEQVVTWLLNSPYGETAESSDCDDSASKTLTEENCNSLNGGLLSESAEEDAKFDDCDTNEPLFWPSESKFSWNSEVLFDCFCMSPRRDGSEVGKSERLCGSKSVMLRLHSRKFKDRKEETCSSRSEVQSKRKNKMTSPRPSKLSISSKGPMGKKSNEKNHSSGELTREDILEECFLSNEDVAVETLVGLNEFDGHEGVDEDFDQGHFSLDEPLRDI